MNPLTISGLDKPLVQLSPDALHVKTLAIQACNDVQSVENSLDAEVASTVLRDVAKLVKECESARVKIKAPVLDLARQIDEVAKTYSSDLEKQSTRIKGLVGAYHARQEEIQRAAERKRQEELARIERERIEAERRAAAEARRIENERLAAEAEARRAAMEAARKAPSWRRICKSLLRNDYWCKGLGFTQHKSAAYQKYLDLMRRRRLEWGAQQEVDFDDEAEAA